MNTESSSFTDPSDLELRVPELRVLELRVPELRVLERRDSRGEQLAQVHEVGSLHGALQLTQGGAAFVRSQNQQFPIVDGLFSRDFLFVLARDPAYLRRE